MVLTINVGALELRLALYKPWGETRYTSGASRTSRQYTGQISEPDLGLYFYQSRFYDSALGRFISADSVVPDPYNPLDYDRYAYVRNNPVKFMDPSGHAVACMNDDGGKGCAGFGPSTILKAGLNPEKTDLYLREFMAARPDYRVERDPLT